MIPTYESILSRSSIRRYALEKPDDAIISEYKNSLKNVSGLNPDIAFFCPIFPYSKDDLKSKSLGAFGRIFSAPYFLAPHIISGQESLLDLGFRTEKIVLDLWSNGLGSCYIGCVHHQKRVIELLGLDPKAKIISMIAFGIPAVDQFKYLYQKISQAFTRSAERLPLSALFLDDSYLKLSEKEFLVSKIIEAGRVSPSATNSQPWRFRIKDDFLEINIKRRNVGKVYDINQEYLVHDSGICMANMTAAALSLGKEIKWEVNQEKIKEDGEDVQPLARFSIKLLKG